MAFDTLITGGEVIDGSGASRRLANVGISDGRIEAVGALDGAESANTIDASGQIVAPGFIDMHSHSDVNLLDDPGGESKAFQGVTTEVTGNCSFSPFPAGKLGEGGLRKAMGTILRSQAPWTWSSLDGWAEATESAGVSLNLAPLVLGAGHRPQQMCVGQLTGHDLAIQGPDVVAAIQPAAIRERDAALQQPAQLMRLGVGAARQSLA